MKRFQMLRFPVALGILALMLADVWAAPRARHVFIVSIDGGKPAVMQKSRMPTLFSLIEQGGHTWNAQTIFPSITLVSHTSMLTGLAPEKHGISWNDWQPAKGVIAVPTIFGLARAKGFSTALFAGKEKFLHLTVPGTLSTFSLPGYKARQVADVAARHIEVSKPNLCFIHFADVDGAGHAHGWGSPQQLQALTDVDGALGVVYRAIWKAGIARDSVILISADHGGHDKHHGSNTADDMTIPWIVWGAGVRRGHTITAPITTYDTAATALWLLDIPIPEGWDGKPIVSVFQQETSRSER